MKLLKELVAQPHCQRQKTMFKLNGQWKGKIDCYSLERWWYHWVGVVGSRVCTVGSGCVGLGSRERKNPEKR